MFLRGHRDLSVNSYEKKRDKNKWKIELLNGEGSATFHKI